MDGMSAKDVYEFSKLTSSHRQIMDDFTQSVVMTMFRDYLSSFKHPEEALEHYMNTWVKNISSQKEEELKALSSDHDSMTDMVVGMMVVDDADVTSFKKDVVDFKDMVSGHIADALKEGKDDN